MYSCLPLSQGVSFLGICVQEMKQVGNSKCFGGWVQRFTHNSTALNCEMTFSVFLPSVAAERKVSVNLGQYLDIFVSDFPRVGVVFPVWADM